MDDARTDSILAEYDRDCALYKEFANKAKMLISDLLDDQGIQVHSITCRAKERDSLDGKLRRSDRDYSSLQDITDLAGVRIITYFADEVDRVAQIIEPEFEIDDANSVDKRALLDPDRFGYLSLHYVCGLSRDRLKLAEYRRFASCKVEIQIRSILQHAWAEIEHDLGYKSKEAVPRSIRRGFARLAGLLEMADIHFDQIRHELDEYEREVPGRIVDSPASVLIDKASLTSLIESNSDIVQLDIAVARVTGAELRPPIDEGTEILVHGLTYHGLQRVSEVIDLVALHGSAVVLFAQKWGGSKARYTCKGVSLYHMCLLLAARTGSESDTLRYLNELNVRVAGRSRQEDAKRLIEVYKEVVGGAE